MTLRNLNLVEKMPSPTRDPGPGPGPGPSGLGILGAIPSLPLPSSLLHPPPSPGTHRALRRLQSAHSLGAKAAGSHQTSPSLISQQRSLQQQLHQQHYNDQLPPPRQLHHKYSAQHLPNLGPQPRAPSPPRRNVSVNRSPQRGRANSDVPIPLVQQQFGAAATMGKRSALSR